MAKRTKFIPKLTHDGWRLNIPAKFTESGKRERYFYKTRELANEAAAGLKEKRDKHGESAKSIPPALAEQATAAAKLLEPFGVPLLDAARRIAEEETRIRGSVDVETATSLFMAAKDDLSVKQKQAIRLTCTYLATDFAGRIFGTLRDEEIAAHLEARTDGNTAFNGRLKILRTLWRWAAKPIRGWCDAEALKHIELKEVIGSEIGTLTADECRALMKAAEEFGEGENKGECALGFAIALFTGIRQAEIERLEPEDITSEGINVRISTNRKSNRRRFIQMPNSLAAWLEAYPVSETVLPPNWQRKETAIRRLAGWRVWSDLVGKTQEEHEAPEDLPAWPQNALRHTAASAALALGKPIETLIFEHGHAEGVTTLKAHYIGKMTKKEALAISSIGPHGTKLSTIVAA